MFRKFLEALIGKKAVPLPRNAKVQPPRGYQDDAPQMVRPKKKAPFGTRVHAR